MKVERLIQWSRTPTPRFQRELAEFNENRFPRVFVRWEPNPIPGNATPAGVTGPKAKNQNGRWVLYVEIAETAHPESRYRDPGSNYTWNAEENCWMMKLQTWEHEDGSFASLGTYLLDRLRQADTWRRRRFYEEEIEEPRREREREQREEVGELSRNTAAYYESYNSPIVRPGSTAGKADWRWRLR